LRCLIRALQHALDYGGLAVLVEAWQQLGLDRLLASIGSPRQRALLQAMIFARLLFPCAKLALAERAAGTLLAPACGLPADEGFDEDDLYDAMDALTGHWCALEKGLAAETSKEPISLVLYDLTSVYFEGAGPARWAQYGHSRDHRSDRPQIILAVATDTRGVPLHLSILRGHRADTTTLQGFVKILRRRCQIREAVFAFDGGMSSKLNLEALEKTGLKFVTRLGNATLEKLLTELPQDEQLELADADKLVEIVQAGKRHVVAGGPWRRQRDQERRAARIAKAEAALAKLAAVKRLKPNAQKIASQAGRTLLTLKAHKYFSYEVDAAARCTGRAKRRSSPPSGRTMAGICSTPTCSRPRLRPRRSRAITKTCSKWKRPSVSSRVTCGCGRSFIGDRIGSSITCGSALS
jgi:hypothetical protein